MLPKGFQKVLDGLFIYVCLHFGPLERIHSRIPLSADLTFGHLASLRGSAGEKTSGPGVFDSNGADKQRIRNVLRSQKDSGCRCKRKCPGPGYLSKKQDDIGLKHPERFVCPHW